MTLQLSMALAGTFPLLGFCVLKKWNGKDIYAKTYIRILRISILLYLLPFQWLKNCLPSYILRNSGEDDIWDDFLVGISGGEYYNFTAEDGSCYVFPKIMVWVWTIGLAVAALFLLYHIWRYPKVKNILMEGARRISPEEYFPESLETEKCRRVRLYESKKVSTPCTAGIFHSYIVLPSKDYTADEKKWIIGHEMAHIRHRDVLWKCLCLACCAFHWYNPFVYYLLYQYSAFCEYYSDEKCMEGQTSDVKKNYAIFLVNAASPQSRVWEPLHCLSTGGKKMRKRIEWLLKDEGKKKNVMAACITLGMCFMSSLTVFAYAPSRQEPFQLEKDSYIIEEYGEKISEEMIDFSQSSEVFIDEEGNEFPLEANLSGSAEINSICIHEYAKGTVAKHTSLSNGGCKVVKYKVNRCKKCGKMKSKTYYSTETFATCPH